MILQSVLEKFKNDKNWNEGNQRFKKEIIWIEKMVNEYANKFDMTPDEVITIMEEKRTYSWPNYYQPANFPDVDKAKQFIGVFKTAKDFTDKYNKFICPSCGDETPSPQECIHRHNNDGVCDWCSFGLISGPCSIIILEKGFKATPIFKPKDYVEVRGGRK